MPGRSSTSEPFRVRSSEFDLYLSPEKVFGALAKEPYAAFLDSAIPQDRSGIFSYIAFRPIAVIRSRGRRIDVIRGGRAFTTEADPLDALRAFVREYNVRGGAEEDGMAGGLIGYFGYELGGQIERLPMSRTDDLHAPDMYFALYDTIFGYNHLRASWRISSFSPQGLGAKHRELLDEIALDESRREAHERSGDRAEPERKPKRRAMRIESNFTRADYLKAVRRAKRHIRDGDIYQVNLSQRFSAELNVSPWELYLKLRKLNPAPYACYLKFPELVLPCSSPELFLRVQGRDVETRPIKGTRPRGATAREDRELKRALAESEKDAAELSMIVDLERNDLGRVCDFGSVEVKDHRRIEPYATVLHTVSTVVGRMREDADLVDLIRATFPGGSISGCPKIRAMEIIDELEPTVRGPYTGSIGYISMTGNADLNIAIRTFVVKGNRVSFQVGGGIVADSDPVAEYNETLDKGKALLEALLATNGDA